MKISELVDRIESCDLWADDSGLLLEVHNAIMGMGTFDDPLDPNLKGISWNQWQLEVSRTATLAVLRYISQEK